MIDITHKNYSLRKATASAIVKVSKPETIDAVKNKTVPKGDVFEFSRAAGLLAIKKTSDVIPDCHPLPIEYAAITYEIEGLQIHIRVEVHTIYKTGVEVETMHGAAVAALTIYDMLKPIDKGVYISVIRLESKKLLRTSKRRTRKANGSALLTTWDFPRASNAP
jgi:molybdenum cofactor biosynthesis protein MoaC